MNATDFFKWTARVSEEIPGAYVRVVTNKSWTRVSIRFMVGKRAGPIRNQRMLDEARPGGVIAFPGGVGTADMVSRAKGAGITVWQPVKKPPTI